jgi:hypothetical protein
MQADCVIASTPILRLAVEADETKLEVPVRDEVEETLWIDTDGEAGHEPTDFKGLASPAVAEKTPRDSLSFNTENSRFKIGAEKLPLASRELSAFRAKTVPLSGT